jgi:putative oxidoreductase
VFTHFYAVTGLGNATFLVLGASELVLLLAFVIGFARRFTYGVVLLLHAGSTLSSWQQYAHPYDGVNLLFFAAWPMLAACAALYLLRDADTLTLDGRQQAAQGQSGRS